MQTKKRPNSAATDSGHIPKQHANDYTATGTQSPPNKGGLIPQSFISDLLDRSDLVEVIDQRVPLKKMGKNYAGLCPFHEEKNPSFSVNPEEQFFYCFGCGIGGDVFNFLMRFDGLGFPEAVTHLARRLGLEVPKESQPDTQTKMPDWKRKRLQDALDLEWLVLQAFHTDKARGLPVSQEDTDRAVLASRRFKKLAGVLHE